MTIRERVDAFKAAFPDHPASWPWVVQEAGRDVLYAIWLTGREYENDIKFYGTYPPRYLAQLMALFPEVAPAGTLHVFSGGLPAGDYVRLDRNPLLNPDVLGDVYDAPAIFPSHRFGLIVADPPYSIYDAAKYQALCDGTLDIKFATGRRRDIDTPGIDQLRTTNALAQVLHPGGILAWLDTTWPMHSKESLVTVGRISLIGSTMHRFRGVSLLERVA